MTALLDPAAKCQVAPGAILVASRCALAAVVDLVAAMAWAMVQADSVESINRHEVLPDSACTARLDRIRNIDMCSQNNQHEEIRVKSAIYHVLWWRRSS